MSRTRDEADYEDAAGENLPWLEPAELEYDDGGGFISRRTLTIAGIAIAAIVALLWAVAANFSGGGDIEIPEDGRIPLVRAPTEPYKVRPDDPGGMDVPQGEIATHAVADGADVNGRIAVDAIPEEPVPVVPPVGTGKADEAPRNLLPDAEAQQRLAAEPKAPPAPEPEPLAPESEAPAPEPAPPAAAGGSSSVQLGAFSSSAKASEAWEQLSGRFSYLAALEKSVESVEVNGQTLYRLRATGLSRTAAEDVCGRLKVAGEQCVVPR